MQEQEKLIEACAKGERKAQKTLYDMYAGSMYLVCIRYAKSELEAEDILQEAFVKVFKSIQGFRGDSKLSYWIKRIVINTALNHQRNKLYMYPMVDVEEMKQEMDYENIISSYQFEELLGMIKSLPAGCQVIFNLYAIEGYNHKEIAQKLGISEGTSKSQYSRAKKLLQDMLLKEQNKGYENVKG